VRISIMARNPLRFLSEAGYMPATGSQIITATTLRTGLGPYMHPNFPPVISRVRRLLTRPAKVYRPAVETSAWCGRLVPVFPAFIALNRLN
jgi:hypothetical protein